MLWGVIALLTLALFETSMYNRRYRKQFKSFVRKIEFDKRRIDDLEKRLHILESLEKIKNESN